MLIPHNSLYGADLSPNPFPVSMALELWVPGKPSHWSRGTPGRGRRVFVSKPVKDIAAQTVIREEFRQFVRSYPEMAVYFPWAGPVRIRVYALYKLPKAHRSKKGFRYPPKLGAPDVSNLLKQVEDAMNQDKSTFDGDKGIRTPYLDDRQIIDARVMKMYHPSREGVLTVLEFLSQPYEEEIRLWSSDPRLAKYEPSKKSGRRGKTSRRSERSG